MEYGQKMNWLSDKSIFTLISWKHFGKYIKQAKNNYYQLSTLLVDWIESIRAKLFEENSFVPVETSMCEKFEPIEKEREKFEPVETSSSREVPQSSLWGTNSNTWKLYFSCTEKLKLNIVTFTLKNYEKIICVRNYLSRVLNQNQE